MFTFFAPPDYENFRDQAVFQIFEFDNAQQNEFIDSIHISKTTTTGQA